MEESLQEAVILAPSPIRESANDASDAVLALEAGQVYESAVLNKRFQVLELIASGGTSHVYRAHDLLAQAAHNERVEIAIKIPQRQ